MVNPIKHFKKKQHIKVKHTLSENREGWFVSFLNEARATHIKYLKYIKRKNYRQIFPHKHRHRNIKIISKSNKQHKR